MFIRICNHSEIVLTRKVIKQQAFPVKGLNPEMEGLIASFKNMQTCLWYVVFDNAFFILSSIQVLVEREALLNSIVTCVKHSQIVVLNYTATCNHNSFI